MNKELIEWLNPSGLIIEDSPADQYYMSRVSTQKAYALTLLHHENFSVIVRAKKLSRVDKRIRYLSQSQHLVQLRYIHKTKKGLPDKRFKHNVQFVVTTCEYEINKKGISVMRTSTYPIAESMARMVFGKYPVVLEI